MAGQAPAHAEPAAGRLCQPPPQGRLQLALVVSDPQLGGSEIMRQAQLQPATWALQLANLQTRGRTSPNPPRCGAQVIKTRCSLL